MQWAGVGRAAGDDERLTGSGDPGELGAVAGVVGHGDTAQQISLYARVIP